MSTARGLWRWPLYPFLLAIWPPLALAAKNPFAVSLVPDLIPAAGTGLLAGMVAYGLVAVISRDHGTTAVVTSVLVLGFWCFRWTDRQVIGSAVIHAIGLEPLSGILVATVVVGSAYLVAVWVVPRVPRQHIFMNVFALVLTATPLTVLLTSGTRPALATQIGPRPEVLEQLDRPTRPNIYIVILDGYAGHAALRDRHGFDNSAFLDALASRGFQVPRSARANYPWTPLALASMLNWEYLPALPTLAASWPPTDLPDLHAPIAANATFRALLRQGYHFRFVPSPIWFASAHPWAHETIGTVRLPAGEFHKAWRSMTPLPELRRFYCRLAACEKRYPWVPESVERFDQKLAAIGRPGPHTAPLLVFAHMMMPHEPYIYDEDCKQATAPLWPDPVRDLVTDEIRVAYARQVECLNDRLLELVDSIMASTPSTPVIVLQSDHGQRYGLGQLPGSPDAVEDWADIFAAYLLPSDRQVVFQDSVTPVTAFRAIFGRPHNGPLSHLPDSTFISSPDSIFALKPWR